MVFVSFAPGDEAWADRVRNALLCIQHMERLECQDRRDCPVACGDVNSYISSSIDAAKAIVVLVSMHFLSDERTRDVDVRALLGRASKNGKEEDLPALALLVGPCPWETVEWLASRQMLPPDGRALSGGDDHQIDLDLTQLALAVDQVLPKSDQ